MVCSCWTTTHNGRRSHNAYLSISPQFDLRERRAIGTFRVSATPTVNVDVTGGFTTTKHSGELPWGASFGFSNDNEVALPYRSRTNDVDVGLQWTNNKAMFRAAYNGSWFNNQADTLTWDNPLVLTDSPLDDGDSSPGHGRMALWPSNSLQTLSAAGYAKLARRTQLTGSLAFGWANNDEPLVPFTVNSRLPQLALPRATADASATTVATNISLVSRPIENWRLSTRFRRYDYSNGMPDTPIGDIISYDTSVGESTTGGPLQYAHARNTFDADATWTGLQLVALTAAYTNNHNTYDFRIFESTNENVLQLKADSAGFGWMNFHARYEYGDRSGSGLDEASLVQIHEQPAMRHYDVADRTRNRFVGQVDVVPNEALMFSVSGGFGKDEFADSYFGLQDAGFRNVTLSADYSAMNGLVVGGSYDYERYSGLARSRSASSNEAEKNDPNRDWTVDSTERVHYFSIYVYPPRIGANTEMRFAYEYAHARGNIFYEVGPALPPPAQLPETFNKLQDFRLDVRHRLSQRLVGDAVLRLRTVQDLRLRVRSQRDRQHRAAELARPRLYLPSLHDTLVRVRHPVLLVSFHGRRKGRHDAESVDYRQSIHGSTHRRACRGHATTGAFTGCGSDQKGPAGLRRPEMLGVPFHRRQGREAEPPRRRWIEALG